MTLAPRCLELGRDFRLAFRHVARRPAFSVAAVLTLALGIGAPVAIFSIVHAVLLRPLPYPEPDRLVQFRIEGRGPTGPMAFDALPAEIALAWAAEGTTFSGLALFNNRALTLTTAAGPYRLSGIAASPNLFDVLGVPPARGRVFDAAARDSRQIVLSHDTWGRYFGGNPDIVGSTVVLDSEAYSVTGVMPPAFGFPTADAAFWVPMLLEQSGGRGMLLPAVARLRPDVTLPQVAADGRTLLESTGLAPRDRQLIVRTMQDQMVGGVRRTLWVLMSAVSFVFAAATANIALLLLTRGAGRMREFSIRLALGAGRGRLLGQLFVEAFVLALIGGAAGVIVAVVALDGLVRLAPQEMPRLHETAVTGSALAFAVLLTLLTSVSLGLLSAGRAVVTDPVRALGRLGDVPQGMAQGPRRRLNLLASGGIAITVVLLVGAGLLLQSFVRLMLVDQGFEPGHATAFQINLPSARYPSPDARLAFHERLLERLSTVPHLQAAGIATMMPNRQPSARFDYNPAGVPSFRDPLSLSVAEVRTVSEGFFEAMGLPLVAGRAFRRDDTAGSEPVMIASERLARQHFPRGDAVGRLLYSNSGTRRVVGVVRDVRPAEPGLEIAPAAYLPLRQDVEIFEWFATVTVVVESSDTAAMASLRPLILSLDPEMPPFNIRRLADEIANLAAVPRFTAALLAGFAVVALIMASVGVYGVTAYTAGQRTHEIGVRVAMGATRAQIMRLVLRDGARLVLAGILVGLGAAVALSGALAGLLHEVTPADPAALTAVAGVLATTGLLAVYLPARRATRVSALEALRHD